MEQTLRVAGWLQKPIVWNVILPKTSMADPEAVIIAAVLAGNTERYAELVNAYQAQAIRIAFSFLGNHEDARDAAQEAFVNAFRGLSRFRQGAKFSTWLYRIIINACKDARRKHLRQPRILATVGDGAQVEVDEGGIFMDLEDPAAGPAVLLQQQELSRHLTGAIVQLPEKQQQAFVLHHLHGFSLEDVAGIMNCRLGTVKSHIFRAMACLRQTLAPWVQTEGERS